MVNAAGDAPRNIGFVRAMCDPLDVVRGWLVELNNLSGWFHPPVQCLAAFGLAESKNVDNFTKLVRLELTRASFYHAVSLCCCALLHLCVHALDFFSSHMLDGVTSAGSGERESSRPHKVYVASVPEDLEGRVAGNSVWSVINDLRSADVKALTRPSHSLLLKHESEHLHAIHLAGIELLASKRLNIPFAL